MSLYILNGQRRSYVVLGLLRAFPYVWSVPIFGAFAKLRKRLLASSCLSVCLSAWLPPDTLPRNLVCIFWKYVITYARRHRKLLDELKGKRGYSRLQEEALDRTRRTACFGRGFGPVVRQTAKWINVVTLRNSLQYDNSTVCCAVLCCAVCCAVLCCTVCCAVLYCAVLCCAVLCCAVLCCAVLCCHDISINVLFQNHTHTHLTDQALNAITERFSQNLDFFHLLLSPVTPVISRYQGRHFTSSLPLPEAREGTPYEPSDTQILCYHR
jgi:hypothetical protein